MLELSMEAGQRVEGSMVSTRLSCSGAKGWSRVKMKAALVELRVKASAKAGFREECGDFLTWLSRLDHKNLVVCLCW
jgi:hypothetical protein